jgi:hypothetical protein
VNSNLSGVKGALRTYSTSKSSLGTQFTEQEQLLNILLFLLVYKQCFFDNDRNNISCNER